MKFLKPTKAKSIVFVMTLIILELFLYQTSTITLMGTPEQGIPEAFFDTSGFVIFSIISIVVSYLIASLIVFLGHKLR